jgi:hypothetical protein
LNHQPQSNLPNRCVVSEFDRQQSSKQTKLAIILPAGRSNLLPVGRLRRAGGVIFRKGWITSGVGSSQRRSIASPSALPWPNLFTQAPDTIAANIAGVVERFAAQGMTTKDYLQAALKQPTLFSMKPATITRHVELIIALYDDGIFTLPRRRDCSTQTAEHPHSHAPFLGFLLRNPVLMSLEEKNIHLRKYYKELTGAEPSSKNLTRRHHEVERELMRHLGHDDPEQPVPKDANPVLRRLIRDGYIKSAKLDSSYE